MNKPALCNTCHVQSLETVVSMWTGRAISDVEYNHALGVIENGRISYILGRSCHDCGKQNPKVKTKTKQEKHMEAY
jgi:hypothetical protein